MKKILLLGLLTLGATLSANNIDLAQKVDAELHEMYLNDKTEVKQETNVEAAKRIDTEIKDMYLND